VLIVFAYEIEPAGAAEFERVYGRDGEWAQFFRSDPAYLGTELHRSADDPLRYLVLDRWASPEAHAAFLERSREEYERRSRTAEALYRREVPLGRFLAPGEG
jgi:heme-degrading monooxygenase HmoA